jgi:proteasome lid subunit RPN8/RPN11
MTPFPSIERWRLPRMACERTRQAVLPAGRRGNESGVFWVGRRQATTTISAVIFPTGPGVVEAPGRWRVAPEVYAAVASWAKPRGLSLLGVVHTHPEHQPRLSRTDRIHGVKVPDALAVIIGRSGDEPDVEAWGWFIYDGGDYRTLKAAERAERLELAGGTIDFATVTAAVPVEARP